MDEQPDTVRALRDRRFKYIRNLHPELPYVLDIDFRNQMPMMQELLELDEAGALEGPTALWFRDVRDPEELYDTDADPHEIHNLANDPARQSDLLRMRSAMDEWLDSADDLGRIPEESLRERFWPGGEQPETATPSIEIAGGTTRIQPGNPGASIGIRIDAGPWRLYTDPFPTSSGSCIEARAIRYGWAESSSVTACAPWESAR
jgi:hypothetical protein